MDIVDGTGIYSIAPSSSFTEKVFSSLKPIFSYNTDGYDSSKLSSGEDIQTIPCS